MLWRATSKQCTSTISLSSSSFGSWCPPVVGFMPQRLRYRFALIQNSTLLKTTFPQNLISYSWPKLKQVLQNSNSKPYSAPSYILNPKLSVSGSCCVHVRKEALQMKPTSLAFLNFYPFYLYCWTISDSEIAQYLVIRDKILQIWFNNHWLLI